MLGDCDLGSILFGLGDFEALWCRSSRFGSVFGHQSKFFRLVEQVFQASVAAGLVAAMGGGCFRLRLAL